MCAGPAICTREDLHFDMASDDDDDTVFFWLKLLLAASSLGGWFRAAAPCALPHIFNAAFGLEMYKSVWMYCVNKALAVTMRWTSLFSVVNEFYYS